MLRLMGFVIQKPASQTAWLQIRVGGQSRAEAAALGGRSHPLGDSPDLANPRALSCPTLCPSHPEGQELAGGRGVTGHKPACEGQAYPQF